MDRKHLFQVITNTLTQIQEMSGREVPGITGRTVPIKDLPGFDSLTGLEFTVMLPSEFKLKEENLCVSEDGTRALCIDEIVDRIMECCNSSAKEKNI